MGSDPLFYFEREDGKGVKYSTLRLGWRGWINWTEEVRE
jgi:hypothetical protein